MASRRLRPAGGKNEAVPETVRAIALRHLRRMVRLRAKIARAGKPGAIHDFRVAARRFQQAFDLLLPADPSAELRDLRRKVVRGRRALSRVRDCDVTIALASAHVAASRSASRQLWKSVTEFLDERRPQKYRRSERKLRRLDLDRTFVRLRVVIDPPPKGSRRHLKAVARSLQPSGVNRKLPDELRRLTHAYSSARGAAARTPGTASIHRLRVAVKRLRYLVEITKRFDSAQSREALGILRAFQETLGDWHDREIEVRLLSRLAKHPERLRGKPSPAGGIQKALEQSHARLATIKRRRPWGLDRTQSGRLEADLLALAQSLAASSRA